MRLTAFTLTIKNRISSLAYAGFKPSTQFIRIGMLCVASQFLTSVNAQEARLDIALEKTSQLSEEAPSGLVATSKASAPLSKPVPTSGDKLAWSSLTTEQKMALAPLASEWDKMDELRKKKWLGVAQKYAQMKPEEQSRVQERIQAWIKMTPAQRMAVRENYTNLTKKSAEQKSAQWQRYQQLSEEEKQKLAKEAKNKKSITTIQPESKRTTPVLQPLKKGPATPSTASQSTTAASIKP